MYETAEQLIAALKTLGVLRVHAMEAADKHFYASLLLDGRELATVQVQRKNYGNPNELVAEINWSAIGGTSVEMTHRFVALLGMATRLAEIVKAEFDAQ